MEDVGCLRLDDFPSVIQVGPSPLLKISIVIEEQVDSSVVEHGFVPGCFSVSSQTFNADRGAFNVPVR